MEAEAQFSSLIIILAPNFVINLYLNNSVVYFKKKKTATPLNLTTVSLNYMSISKPRSCIESV